MEEVKPDHCFTKR